MNYSLLQNDHHQPHYGPSPVSSLGKALVFATNIFNTQCAYTSEARIGLICDKPYYVAGEMITGTITATVYSPLRASGIVLQCKGYEKVEWNEEHTKQVLVHNHHHHHHHHHHHNNHHHHHNNHPQQQYETEYYIKRHRGKQVFFSQTLRIYQMLDGVLMPGNYSWPFQYQLPDGIPGSFFERTELTSTRYTRIEEDDHCKHETFYDSDDDCDDHHHHEKRKMPAILAVVNYSLTATLDQNGMMRRDLRSKQPLVVHPRLGANIEPSHGEKTSEVMLCCCIPRGECTVKAHFDKNAYVPGETANIIAQVINGSTRSMKLAVRLVRTLKLNARGRPMHGMSKTETINVLEMKYADVKEKETVDKTLTLSLPVSLKPSTQGSYVQCTYMYVVEVQIPMAPDIEVHLPVLLYMPQPPPPPQAQPPMAIQTAPVPAVNAQAPAAASASAPPPPY